MSAVINTTTSEENKAIIRRARKIWTGKNLAIFDELYAPDYRNHDSAQPNVRSLEDFKGWIEEVRDGLSDVRLTCEDTVAENDKITERWTLCSKYKQSHKWFKWSGISIYRIAGGKIAECWWHYDWTSFSQNRSLLQQLGPPERRKFWQLVLEDQLPCKEESRKRNVAITAQYASWYLEKPEVFKWAGMAAFVSNAVGLFIPIADDGDWILFKETNNAIFEDIGWAFLAYKHNQFEEIKDILGFERDTYLMRKGFQLIKRGEDLLENNQNVAKEMINLGSALLARHEQYVVAQKFFGQYGPAIRALLLTMLGLIDFDGDPLAVSNSFQVRFQDLVDLRRFKDFGEANDRWEFVAVKLFPKWWEADRSPQKISKHLNRLANRSPRHLPGLITVGAIILKWVTNGVFGLTNWLDERIKGSISDPDRSEQKSFLQRVVLPILLLIFRFIFVLAITPLILITPGLIIVYVLLQGSRLRDWWRKQPRQSKQSLRRNLLVALASAAGIILLVLGCQFLSRLAPDITPPFIQPSSQLHSTFVSSQPIVQARVGRSVPIDSYHTSPARVDSIEIFVNGQRLGTTGVLDAEQADTFPGHFGSVQIRSRGSLEGSVFRPEASNTTTTVTLIWEGYVPGTYELTLVAKDKTGQVGQPIVQPIEVR